MPPSTTCGSSDSSGAANPPSTANKAQQINRPVRDRPPAASMCSARAGSSDSGSPPTSPEATLATPSASTSRRGSVRLWHAWSSARLLSTRSSVPISAITRPALSAAAACRCSKPVLTSVNSGARVSGCGQAARSSPVSGPSALGGSTTCSRA